MKPQTIHRHTVGTYHSPDDACLGLQIRRALHSADLPAKSPLRVLASMLALPVGSRFLKAFRNVPLNELSLSGAWLRIPIQLRGMKNYAITVPNFLRWHNVNRSALKNFCASCDDDLAVEIRHLLSAPSLRLSWTKIVTALESSVYGEGHSPVLVRYINGLDAFAMVKVKEPLLSLAAARTTSGDGELLHSLEPDHSGYPQFKRTLARFADCVLGTASGEKIWTAAIEQVDSKDTSDDALLVRAGFWFNQIVLTDGKARDLDRWLPCFQEAKPEALANIRPRTLSSRLAYMQQMIPALEILRNGGGKPTQGAVVCAGRILQASCLFDCIPPTSSLMRAAKMPSAEIVPWPNAEPLRNDGSNCTDLQSAARQVLEIILVQGFQRFRSLRSVSQQEILCSGAIVEVRIPDDKGGARERVIPIYRLAPPHDVDILREFRARPDAAGIPLTELAGFGSVGAKGGNSKAVYRAMLKWAGKLHMPRKIGLSFAPLRAQVFRNPNLRNHPYFPEELREHWWFSDEGLAQFGRLIPAVSTDVAEVLRRIAGWTTYGQLFSSYCRTWHIQLALLLPVKRRAN